MLARRSSFPPGRGFGRRAPSAAQVEDREDLLAQRAARAMDSARATAGMVCASVVVMGAASTSLVVPKAELLECEAYRRAVAALRHVVRRLRVLPARAPEPRQGHGPEDR